jgi:glycosyltransferase involved in cell wall biosynthesis
LTSPTPGPRLALEREAVRVLQSIAGQGNALNDARLGKHLRFLLDIGFLTSTLTPDGISYQVTKDGARFLQEYEANNGGPGSATKSEMDWVIKRLLKNQVTVIIPTLNEAEAIGGVVSEVLAQGYNNIMVVDGYSTDLTVERAQRAGAAVIYQHGSGKSAAVKTAIEQAETPYVLFMDGDGTYDPKDIERLLNHSDHYAHIIGIRDRKQIPIVHRFGNWIISHTFSALFNVKTRDVCSGMYLLETDQVKQYNLEDAGFTAEIELASQSAAYTSLVEAPISYRPRIGTKKLNTWRDGLTILSEAFTLARRYNPILLYSFLAGLSIIPAAIVLGWVVFEGLTMGIWNSGSAILGVMLLLVAAQSFTLAGVSILTKHSHDRLMRAIKSTRATS